MKFLFILTIIITSTLSIASDNVTISAEGFLFRYNKFCKIEANDYDHKMKSFGMTSELFTNYYCDKIATDVIENTTGKKVYNLEGSHIELSLVASNINNECDENFNYQENQSLKMAYANYACKDAISKTVSYFLRNNLEQAKKLNRKISERRIQKTINDDRARFTDKRISIQEKEEFKKAIRAN